MSDENFLEDLLIRNDFLVKVVLLDENVLAVDFAGKKQVTYSVLAEEKSSNYDVTFKGYGITEEFVLSGTIVRLFILMDIYQQARRLGLPDVIVRFYSKEKIQTSFIDILPLDLTQKEIDNEKKLNSAMERAYAKPDLINEMDCKLEKIGLLKQFTLLKGLLL